MMLDEIEFARIVASAYQYLYDFVALRSHPLTDLLVPDPELRRKQKAWIVHDILINIIDELALAPSAPVFSREWRRHRLLVLRYGDGVAPKLVATELSVSLRHYYREHDAAIEAIADILWYRYITHSPLAKASIEPVEVAPAGDDERPALPESQHSDRIQLLRAEASHLRQESRFVQLASVVPEIVELVYEMAKQKNIEVKVQLRPDYTTIDMDRGILRQILAGVLAHLVELVPAGPLHIREEGSGDCTVLSIYGQRPCDNLDTEIWPSEDVQLKMLGELATMQRAQLQPLAATTGFCGFQLDLPSVTPRTVLLVDDNADTLDLFQRYLQHHHYATVSTQSSVEALHLALKFKPYAIVLDLMLPEYDGWDTLQKLVNHPNTHHIPVVICTILATRHLALSLGAAAFLEKPVKEAQLVATLDALVNA
jgi:CheY-like chemotaxis protein